MKLQLTLATAFAALVVTGCTQRATTTHWTDDCMKHYSTNAYELKSCQDRVAKERAHVSTEQVGQVNVNPNSGELPGFQGDAPQRGSNS